MTISRLTHHDARLLLLQGQCLLDDPDKRCGPAKVRRLIGGLGFVQLDSINVVERAHHLTLLARNRSYRKSHLDALYSRAHVFEHWTHDASVLPVEWHGHWRHQRERFTARVDRRSWLKRRIGEEPEKVLALVLERIEAEGPLRSSDFEHEKKEAGGWWNWKPAKAALEYLWWRGDLTVVGRPNFHKVYDLTARHIRAEHRADSTELEAFITWSTAQAIHRLGIATTKEIAAFLATISLAEARTELEAMAKRGHVERVQIDGKTPLKAYAVPDWKRRLAKARTLVSRMDGEPRLLSPFDPIARDRDRMLRLFDFDYRFEAFTPEAKRVHGYYVLPVLQRGRLVARTDLKHHRKSGVLEAKGIWWERGAARDDDGLEAALNRLANFIGAESTVIRRRRSR